MSAREQTDDELLAGDADAFAVFYRRHSRWVLAYLARRTRDPELAADLCAEVFAAALVGKRRFKPRDGTANSWLFRITLNKLNDALRRGYAEDRARRRLQMERVVPDEDDLAYIASLGDETRALPLLDELAPEQREAVRARIIDERDYDEIAATQETSEAAVRQRVSRGLGHLRSRLGGRG